jgi:glycosyltransferase involved in cell wall biosynthesis
MSQNRSVASPINLVVPGPIDTLTGGFIYDRHMAAAMRNAARLGSLICLEGAYPSPSAATLEDAATRLASVSGGILLIDGLALTALAGHSGAIPLGCEVIALIHHPLCDETGLSASEIKNLFEAERQALTRASGCIVTSPTTARRLADFGVAPDRIRVVIPGLDQPVAEPSAICGIDGPMELLCVATLSPRKGQDLLLAALAELQDLDWHLNLVGAERDPAFSDQIKSMVLSLDMAKRVRFHGEVEGDTLASLYRGADIFVLPSHHEGFGMALTEAMSHGLPIVSTNAGAIPETVPHGAGELLPPDDAGALTASLRHFISNSDARAKAGDAAKRAAKNLPSWSESGAIFIAAVDDLHKTSTFRNIGS